MSNPYAVVLDASVLAQTLHRHLLVNLAAAECFRPIWSDTILAETSAAVVKRGGNGERVRRQLEEAFPSSLADPSYIHLVRTVQLDDDDDRHVVAVALQEHADAICSDNVADFGLSTIEVLACDEFVTNTLDLAPVRAFEALSTMRRSMTSVSDGIEFVALIRNRGLTAAADYLTPYSDRL